MGELRDHALLLRRIPFRETSLICHFLTEKHGRITLMARGARRSKSATRAELSPLCRLQLRWHQGRGDIGTLLEVERQRTLLADASILEGQELLALASQLFREQDPHGYIELMQALEMLDRYNSKSTGLAAARWLLLMQAGWAADLTKCWQCNHDFSLKIQPLWSHGMLHCTACDHGKLLDIDGLQQMAKAWNDSASSLHETHRSLWQKMADSILYHAKS